MVWSSSGSPLPVSSAREMLVKVLSSASSLPAPSILCTRQVCWWEKWGQRKKWQLPHVIALVKSLINERRSRCYLILALATLFLCSTWGSLTWTWWSQLEMVRDPSERVTACTCSCWDGTGAALCPGAKPGLQSYDDFLGVNCPRTLPEKALWWGWGKK